MGTSCRSSWGGLRVGPADVVPTRFWSGKGPGRSDKTPDSRSKVLDPREDDVWITTLARFVVGASLSYLHADPLSDFATCRPQAMQGNSSPVLISFGCDGNGVLVVPSSASSYDASVRA